jgi:hypothetical protein
MRYTIIGYTSDAAFHCPACTRARWAAGQLTLPHAGPPELDEHNVPVDTIDREGNTVHPVFVWDDIGREHCDDCREPLD